MFIYESTVLLTNISVDDENKIIVYDEDGQIIDCATESFELKSSKSNLTREKI